MPLGFRDAACRPGASRRMTTEKGHELGRFKEQLIQQRFTGRSSGWPASLKNLFARPIHLLMKGEEVVPQLYIGVTRESVDDQNKILFEEPQ